MRTVRTILLAVKEPAAAPMASLAKAAQIARAFDARLELFHAITEPLFGDSLPGKDKDLGRIRTEVRAARLGELEHLASRIPGRLPDISVAAEWDYPPAEALVRRAARIRADLIIAARHSEERSWPWLLAYSDWELLRLSPVPVLLMRSPGRYPPRPVILAAVDPTHAYAKPARLDQEILAAAASLRGGLGGSVHAMHAYLPPLPRPGRARSNGAAVAAELESAAAEAAAADLERVVKAAGIPRRNRHLVPSHPVDAIPRTARKTGSAIVVMGAISRSGLKRLLIGNTAEQVLDRLPCDVLVVKPPRLASPVKQAKRTIRPRAAAPAVAG